jgi:hypothetical protein
MRGRRGSSRGLIKRLRPIDHAGARPGYLQDMCLQSRAWNVARQSHQVRREAQTVQVISSQLL